MEKLSAILWQERELLEDLLYHLELEQLVLASGRTRWLMRAAQDVEAVLEQMRKSEVMRAVAAEQAAGALGLGANPSMQQLVDSAEEPWRTIFNDHRDALVGLTREIAALADTNRELVSNGYRSARETLMTLSETAEGYGADGAAVLSTESASRIDRTL